jgi:hypothetical protein
MKLMIFTLKKEKKKKKRGKNSKKLKKGLPAVEQYVNHDCFYDQSQYAFPLT